jgi:cytochrome c5
VISHSRAIRTAVALGMAAAVFGGSASRLPEGPGKKTVEAECATCHDLDVVTEKRFTRQRWQVIVTAMMDGSAAARKNDIKEVVDYLAANFGEQDRGRELVEDICSVCHEWQRVKQQELTKDEWAGTIRGMIDQGAPVTDEEFEQMVNYLARNFGKKE